MKRWAHRGFAAAVLLLLILPLCGANYTAIGREVLEQRPWLAAAAQSFDHHSGYRRECVDAYDRLNAALFRDAGTDTVLMGRDMLFFARTLPDYQQSTPMTDEEIGRAADTLRALSEQLAQQGVDFAFLCAPNKNEIYPERMPARYKRGESSSDAKRLQRELTERGVMFIDALSLLRGAEEPVYHRTDTHWNDRGALMVYRSLMDTLGLDADYYERAEWTDVQRVGDLEQMAFPLSANPERVRMLKLERKYRTEKPMRSLDDMKIVAHAKGKQARLLVSRDSFGEALFPLLANQCETLVYTRSRDMDELLALSFGMDAVVYELAQRNLRLLIGEEEGLE